MPQDAMRVLVLGTGPDAEQARQSLTRQGIAVAQRLTKTVTHLVADDTVADTDPRLQRARAEGVEALPPHFLARYPVAPRPEYPTVPVNVAPRREPPLVAGLAETVTALRDSPLTKLAAGGGSKFIGSPVWALLPLVTLGFAAPIVIVQAAYRLKSLALNLSAAGYGLAVMAFIVIIGAHDSPDAIPAVLNFIAALAFFSTWLGATVQAFLLRPLIREAARPVLAADALDH